MMNEILINPENYLENIEGIEAELAQQFPPMTVAKPFTGDEESTWVYWTNLDTADRGIPEEWVWERLRLKRDTMLAACDYRMITDAPWDISPWITYRQALRDLPKITKDPRLAEWPVIPNV
jgi:hypothetical protein